jgi:hypothetical protein
MVHIHWLILQQQPVYRQVVFQEEMEITMMAGSNLPRPTPAKRVTIGNFGNNVPTPKFKYYHAHSFNSLACGACNCYSYWFDYWSHIFYQGI